LHCSHLLRRNRVFLSQGAGWYLADSS
jgi:hypothetical protein